MERKKGKFNFKAMGKIIKKENDGSIINIMLFDRFITFCESLVSQ